jgi:uncharacterized membrane protein
MRPLLAVNVVLALALTALSVYVYPWLPERIPTHFGADGAPDAWSERSLLMWLLLPLIGAGTALLMCGIAALMPTRPHLLNIPDKKKLLALPPALQRRVMTEAAMTLYVMSVLLLVMFGLMQYGAYESARSGRASGGMVAGIVVGLAGLPLLTIWMIVRIRRELDAAWREHRVKGAAAGGPV